MNSLDFFKELYYKVFERRENTLTKSGFILTIITLISGVLFFFYEHPPIFNLNLWCFLFWISFSISIIFLFLSIYHLLQIIRPKEFQNIPLPSTIYKYKEELTKYYQENDSSNCKRLVDEELSNFLEKCFVDAAQFNGGVVYNESSSFYYSKKNIYYSIVFCITGIISYAMCNPIETVQKIEITNWKGVTNMENTDQGKNNQNQQGSSTSSGQQSQKPVTPKPTAPKNIIVKESDRKFSPKTVEDIDR